MTDDTPDTTRNTPDATAADVVSRDTPHDTGRDMDATRQVPTHDTDALLSQQEAAALAGVSVRTLQRAAVRGDIARDTTDGHPVYRVADVEAWRVARLALQPVMARHAIPATPPHAGAVSRVADPAPTSSVDAAIHAAVVAERDALAERVAAADARLDAVHAEHGRAIAELGAAVQAQAATIAAQSDALLRLQAAALLPHVVAGPESEHAPKRTETARDATDPPPAMPATLKRPSLAARLLGWLPFP